MTQTLLLLVFFIALPAVIHAQPAGYDEEMLPSMVKISGHVRKMKVKVYYPAGNADTLGESAPDEIQTYTFDTAGQVTRIEYATVRFKRHPNSFITYKYFGKDSVITCEPRGSNYIHKTKTINKYDDQHRLVERAFYVSQYPATLKPVRFLASVTNVYDSAGFIARQLHRGENGEEYVTEFVNDKKGNHIMISPPCIDNLGNLKQATYQYDEHNNPVYTNNWAYRYIYDDQGNWTRLTQYMNMYLHDASTGGFSKLLIREITYY